MNVMYNPCAINFIVELTHSCWEFLAGNQGSRRPGVGVWGGQEIFPCDSKVYSKIRTRKSGGEAAAQAFSEYAGIVVRTSN